MIFKHKGKSRKQIANEIKNFVYTLSKDSNIEFYGYYSAYDWVVFCWLFGIMMDLPYKFPMFAHDLKSMLDFVIDSRKKEICDKFKLNPIISKDDLLSFLKTLPNYPKQSVYHSALEDTMWNKEFHQFILSII